jgi:HSP20 family protein
MKTMFTTKEVQRTIKLGGEIEVKKQTIEEPVGYGQLPIDILENDKEILIIAPLAGVDIEQAEVVINNDVLTIRGKRNLNIESYGFKRKDYFVQECFWGEFSRSVILPTNIDTHTIEATQQDHILYIKIQKRMNLQIKIVRIKTK